jgi:teichuronic acid exporter
MTPRILASLVWLGSASLFGQIVSWLSTLVVIRLLSPDDYGLIVMAMLPITFLLVVGDLGLGVVVVQAPALGQPQLRALFGASLVTHVLAAVLVFVAAPLVATFFGEPQLVPLVRALSLCFVFVGVYALPQALIARALQFDRKAKGDSLAALASSIVAVALATGGGGPWALVGAALVAHAFRAVAFQILHPCFFLRLPGLAELRGSVRFAGWVTVDRALWFGYTNLDVAIAGRVLGGAVLGVYSVAVSLASIPLDKVMPVVNEISLSAFSRIQNDRERVRRGMLRALETVGLVAFPAFLGLAAVAPEVVDVFLGERWNGAVLPLQILCLVFPFRALGLLFAPALFGSGRPRLVVENNALTLGCVGIALGVGVQWGVVGLCVGWVAGYVPVFCVAAHRTLRALDIPAREVMAKLALPIVAAAVMAAAVGTARALASDAWPSVAVLIGLIVCGVGIYVGAVAAFRPEVVRSVRVLSLQKR